MSSWDISESYNGIRFFAQQAEELLFFYSHDSFKVPTLNFHFLCFEAINTLDYIEDSILDKGNIVPVVAELIDAYKKDPVIKTLYNCDFDRFFSTKSADGKYRNNLTEIFKNPKSEQALQSLRRGCEFLVSDLSRQNRYYFCCVDGIEKLISKENIEYEEIEELRQYIRILLTELINIGYSQEYIYRTVKTLFFNESYPVTNASERFNEFIGFFSLKDRNYIVYLPANNYKIRKDLLPFKGIHIAENVYEMFDGKCSLVIKIKNSAKDPDGAKIEAISILDFCLSISQYSQHTKPTYSFAKAEVVDLEGKTTILLDKPPMLIARQKRTPMDSEKLINACLGLNLVGAIGMHSSAFASKAPENQLLNLWTAMELLFPVDRNGSLSKINQIANNATTVLSSGHIRTLITKLDADIEKELSGEYDSIVEKVDLQVPSRVNKLLAIIVLSEYQEILNELEGALKANPLIKFRLRQYSELLSDCGKIKSFYESHSNRLTWQIMRIYRNRNMIVHDGESLPFIELILQNLHYYIDTIIDCFCERYLEGFGRIETILSDYISREQAFLELLDKNESLTKDNFFMLVLGVG